MATTTTTTEASALDENLTVYIRLKGGDDKNDDDGENNNIKDETVAKAATTLPFYHGRHVHYIRTLSDRLDASSSMEGAMTLNLRMSGIYWTLASLSLLVPTFEHADRLLGVTQPRQQQSVSQAVSSSSSSLILDWLFDCYDAKTGGFAGCVGDDGHLLYTLSALQILAMADRLHDPRLQREAVVAFIASLQNPDDGSFAGDAWGEIDTRFTYCALSALALLQSLHAVQVRKAALYILACLNLDGGFGAVAGAESHAGQVFCCIGALAIAESLDLLLRPPSLVPTTATTNLDTTSSSTPTRSSSSTMSSVNLLGWWLAERQVDSGGLNGRPEKQADVCYSWWILSALSILGKVSWINGDRLAQFILKCQDPVDGGIADRPDDMPDVFHTFFGICGLSLLGHLDPRVIRLAADDTTNNTPVYRQIDPVYALPTDVVRKLQLPGQVMTRKGVAMDERLSQYKVVLIEK